jgi:hypothetical protein
MRSEVPLAEWIAMSESELEAGSKLGAASTVGLGNVAPDRGSRCKFWRWFLGVKSVIAKKIRLGVRADEQKAKPDNGTSCTCGMMASSLIVICLFLGSIASDST